MNRRKKVKRLGAKTISFPKGKGHLTHNNREFISKSDNIYMAKVMTLFVYIKLFESIVTVEGEDFLNSREEKECYKLVRESTKFIYDRLEEFSKYNCKTASDELNRHMRNMFKNMRSSLKEEVGSIKKDFL